LAVIAGVFVAITLSEALKLFFATGNVPSNIVEFDPVAFRARADTEFFYSLGNELKYSDQIDPQAPALMRGEIRDFLVSPDNKKIAVVANGKLVVAGAKSTLRQVTSVNSIYREHKPVGRQLFRDDHFQWSKDSKVLYLIRDQFYKSRGGQLFSSKGELWKYDMELLPWRQVWNLLFDPERLARRFVEAPFYSFSIHDYERAVRSSKRVDLAVDGNSRRQKLVIRDKPYLTVTQGKGFYYYCSEMLGSVFLPGDPVLLV